MKKRIFLVPLLGTGGCSVASAQLRAEIACRIKGCIGIENQAELQQGGVVSGKS